MRLRYIVMVTIKKPNAGTRYKYVDQWGDLTENMARAHRFAKKSNAEKQAKKYDYRMYYYAEIAPEVF